MHCIIFIQSFKFIILTKCIIHKLEVHTFIVKSIINLKERVNKVSTSYIKFYKSIFSSIACIYTKIMKHKYLTVYANFYRSYSFRLLQQFFSLVATHAVSAFMKPRIVVDKVPSRHCFSQLFMFSLKKSINKACSSIRQA